MPLIKLELEKGFNPERLQTLKEVVLQEIISVLKLPENDRNIRVLEYEPHLFELKPPYRIIIEITLFAGRTRETKKILFSNLVNILHQHGLFQKEEVYIILNEQPLENWGVRGGIQANELNLGFKVDI